MTSWLDPPGPSDGRVAAAVLSLAGLAAVLYLLGRWLSDFPLAAPTKGLASCDD